MSKKIIAIDIDDVLADATEALRVTTNELLPPELRISKEKYRVKAEYWGYYETVWRANKVDHLVSFERLHDDMAIRQDHVNVIDGAKNAVKQLNEKYRLVAVTSRRVQWVNSTHEWLEKRFPGNFRDVIFVHHDNSDGRTKGDACKDIGATWLLDDNPEHCLTAEKAGTQPVLFGEYGWTEPSLSKGFEYCKDWREVLEYFDGQS